MVCWSIARRKKQSPVGLLAVTSCTPRCSLGFPKSWLGESDWGYIRVRVRIRIRVRVRVKVSVRVSVRVPRGGWRLHRSSES